MSNISRVGVDLAKNHIQVHAVDLTVSAAAGNRICTSPRRVRRCQIVRELTTSGKVMPRS